jgi:hypothetical protein
MNRFPLRRLASATLAVWASAPPVGAAEGEPKTWKEDALVASYAALKAAGTLEAAVRAPALPSGPADGAFLAALAWHTDGMPKGAGSLTLAELDAALDRQVRSYLELVAAKAEKGAANDYPRTRTWKLVQKLTMLRQETAAAGVYAYPALAKGPSDRAARSWENLHTVASAREFSEKVCKGSFARPVLVKYGNTNCTQCMLFEIIGSIKELAESPALKGSVDVYKVWWGFEPDAGYAGLLRKPERLDRLAKAEGVTSSPFFIVYRNGRRYPCGDAFPDEAGPDARLKACLAQEFGEAPAAAACAPESAASGGGR